MNDGGDRWIKLDDATVERVLLAAEARRRREQAAAGADAGGADGARLLRVADVTCEPVRWLWKPWLPAGKLVVIDGDPGRGKSTLALDLAARVTTGSPMPDGAAGPEPGAVLILSAEDGIADTIRPRLESHGAALERVLALAGVADERGERPAVLPEDVPLLERIVREHYVRLIVIDPLVAFLGAEVDSHVDASVRRALHALARLADSTGAVVLCVRHLRKSGGARAVYAGGGSIGIIGAARVGWLVAADPGDPERRVLACSKSNLGPLPRSLAFRLVPDSLLGVARISWEGATDHRADDLVAAAREGDEERSAEDEASEFLRDALADGPRPARELLREARECGIAERTLRRACRSLGVEARRVGGKASRGHWEWSLIKAAKPLGSLNEGADVGSLKENGLVMRFPAHSEPPSTPKTANFSPLAVLSDGEPQQSPSAGPLCEPEPPAEPEVDLSREAAILHDFAELLDAGVVEPAGETIGDVLAALGAEAEGGRAAVCAACGSQNIAPISGMCRSCGWRPWSASGTATGRLFDDGEVQE